MSIDDEDVPPGLGYDGPPNALMTTKELARYLRLNERTVLKLAASGEVPGVRLGNQWRFRRAIIDAWLDDEMLGVHRGAAQVSPPAAGVARPAVVTFEDVFAPEHVVLALPPGGRSEALAALAARAGELRLVLDKTWFLGALLERETVLTTAVGDGLAFPHTLDRHPEQVVRPFLLFGRSLTGFEAGAPDGRPVHLVMVMGLRYQALHLPWLKRLSTVLRAPALRAALLAAPDAELVRGLLAEALAGVELMP
jgi:excisionase family DNA binding protein